MVHGDAGGWSMVRTEKVYLNRIFLGWWFNDHPATDHFTQH